MKKNTNLFFIAFSLLISSLCYSETNKGLFKTNDSNILINNRILTRVNGKAISVIDVMKKMDMLFYKQFPQYSSSVEARFQFYTLNWKKILQDLIDKELVMADAEEKKMTVSVGDVRREMESLFGPNIILNLDKAGLSLEDATKMVQDDIILKRMLYFRANAKAFKQVTPQVVKEAYDKYAKENQRPEMWEYRVISIRHPDAAKGEKIAICAFDYLTKEGKPLEGLADYIEKAEIAEGAKITVSDKFKHTEKEMAAGYKDTLEQLKMANYSNPIAQKSRTDKSMVYRIFLLENKIAAGAPPFNEVDDELRDKLLDVAIDKETNSYIAKLRKHYHIDETQVQELVSDNFEPFVMR